MDSKYYDIRLTPLNRFFFGQEVVFGGSGSDERRRSYLVHSGHLPQQTSLLGLMREQVLRANDALLPQYPNEAQRKKAAQLVGDQGFHLENSLSDNRQSHSYGIINSLSPLEVRDQSNNRYLPRPLDDMDTPGLRWERKGVAWELCNYDHKSGVNLRFALPNGEQEIKVEDLFAKQSTTGNRISNRRYRHTDAETGDEGLFRQTTLKSNHSVYASARLQAASPAKKPPKHDFRDFSFWFRVELAVDRMAEEQELKLPQPGIVTLGGERSTFWFDIRPAAMQELAYPITYRNPVTVPANMQRLLFVSDAFLSSDAVLGNDRFLLGLVRPFRFFTSSLKRSSHFFDVARSASGRTGGLRQSRRYDLIERGAVLLVADDPEGDKAARVSRHIEQFNLFRQIGYNFIHQLGRPGAATNAEL